MVSAGRVTLRHDLAEDYESITGRPGEKPPYRNSLFRRGCMLALLDELPWYHPFDKLFAEWPHEFFVQTDTSPQKLAWFWADARKKMKEVQEIMTTDPHDTTPEENGLLAATINRFIRHYLDSDLRRRGTTSQRIAKRRAPPQRRARLAESWRSVCS